MSITKEAPANAPQAYSTEQERQAIKLPSGQTIFTAGEGHNPARGIYTYEGPQGGQKYLREDRWELRFKGSKRFPKGIWIGITLNLIQPDVGQPYPQDSYDPFTTDQADELAAFAAGEVYRTIGERRRSYEQSQRNRELIQAAGQKALADEAAAALRRAGVNPGTTDVAAPQAPTGA